MNIIGLGHAGCEIASNFQNYDNYKTFFIDCENPKKRKKEPIQMYARYVSRGRAVW